ncbi:MAG: type I-G CRISPR-associated helicase/endonuclease Cas3g [Deferrisomatales bacterium]
MGNYQETLGVGPWPDLLNIPTGLGKTAGVVVAWLWKRLNGDADTPRRLVYCLPMRVLVEQTFGNAGQWTGAAAELFGAGGASAPSVHLLMGGEKSGDWSERPEGSAILIGTQDMLLSRALMRGYGMSRYHWPIHFALLHNDALWVFDEVQLMGPGLATSAQLDAFRRSLPLPRPSRTVWVSATLHRDWLATVDLRPHLPAFQTLDLAPADRSSQEVRRRVSAPKTLARAQTRLTDENQKKNAQAYAEALAAEVLGHHRPGTNTLVVVNTVERAQAVFQAIAEGGSSAEVLLVHSRFRPSDRRRIEARMKAPPGTDGRVLVATQAVEAGVDLTSATLFTELAPWTSLVQRFGRCNRYGECQGAAVYWIDVDEGLEPPYEAEALALGRTRVDRLASASPLDLPPADEDGPLVPVIRRKDFLALFNTDPDLSGFDVDVSPYIRDADDTEVQVFWREAAGDGRPEQPGPAPDELCRVSLGQMDKYLGKKAGKVARAAYLRDSVGERWVRLRGRPRPGMTLMLDSARGGYDDRLGFAPAETAPVAPIVTAESPAAESYGGDRRSLGRSFVGLTAHLADARGEAQALGAAVGADGYLPSLLRAAGWHDVGKTHTVFQNTLTACPEAVDEGVGPWAKSPCRGRHERPHFRHELASALAWLAHRGSEPAADLVAYLIAAHHGKVRMGLRALPNEKEPHPPKGPRFARGIWEGDELPGCGPADEQIPPTILQLGLMELGEGAQGPSWSARTQKLLTEHGPFRLAWLETLVRIADWRASAKEQQEDLR